MSSDLNGMKFTHLTANIVCTTRPAHFIVLDCLRLFIVVCLCVSLFITLEYEYYMFNDLNAMTFTHFGYKQQTYHMTYSLYSLLVVYNCLLTYIFVILCLFVSLFIALSRDTMMLNNEKVINLIIDGEVATG